MEFEHKNATPLSVADLLFHVYRYIVLWCLWNWYGGSQCCRQLSVYLYLCDAMLARF